MHCVTQFFLFAIKLEKCLACKVPKEMKRILKLQERDTILMEDSVIQKAFYQNYSNLYKVSDIPLEKIYESLKKANLPRVQKDRDRL